MFVHEPRCLHVTATVSHTAVDALVIFLATLAPVRASNLSILACNSDPGSGFHVGESLALVFVVGLSFMMRTKPTWGLTKETTDQLFPSLAMPAHRSSITLAALLLAQRRPNR